MRRMNTGNLAGTSIAPWLQVTPTRGNIPNCYSFLTENPNLDVAPCWDTAQSYEQGFVILL